jgi:hypothetical protein
MKARRSTSRIMLIAVLVVSMLLCQVGTATIVGPGTPEGAAAQIEFTPHVTPLAVTEAPRPTVPVPFGQQLTPVPSTAAVAATPLPPQPISGGDSAVGFDFIENSATPMWRVWFEGEAILVYPGDPLVGALLAAFREESAKRLSAARDLEDARRDLGNATAAGGFGLLAVIGGAIVAPPSCAGTPFTFWAAGGAGWACAGGIAAFVGGAGAVVVSAIQGIQAGGDIAAASEEFNHATEEAGDLFEALKEVSGP